jgi:hypothetical protein
VKDALEIGGYPWVVGLECAGCSAYGGEQPRMGGSKDLPILVTIRAALDV